MGKKRREIPYWVQERLEWLQSWLDLPEKVIVVFSFKTIYFINYNDNR